MPRLQNKEPNFLESLMSPGGSYVASEDAAADQLRAEMARAREPKNTVYKAEFDVDGHIAKGLGNTLNYYVGNSSGVNVGEVGDMGVAVKDGTKGAAAFAKSPKGVSVTPFKSAQTALGKISPVTKAIITGVNLGDAGKNAYDLYQKFWAPAQNALQGLVDKRPQYIASPAIPRYR